MAQFAVSDPENIQTMSESIEEETAVAGVVFRNLVGTHSQIVYVVSNFLCGSVNNVSF